jgi:hypothetical protein
MLEDQQRDRLNNHPFTIGYNFKVKLLPIKGRWRDLADRKLIVKIKAHTQPLLPA